MQSRPLMVANRSALLRQLEKADIKTPVEEILGKMAAVLTTPTMVMPNQWLGELLEESSYENEAQGRSLIAEIMTAYNTLATALMERKLIGPSTDSIYNIQSWCRGYCEVALADREWRDNEEAVAMLRPVCALAGLLDDPSLPADQPQPSDSALEHDLEGLPEVVRELHAYWLRRRPKPKATPRGIGFSSAPTTFGPSEDTTYRREDVKVGRNSPCPCGSNKKYKLCCAGKTTSSN